MSLADDKKGVITSIGAFSSMRQERELPNLTNTLTSINNKRDAIPFQLDVLKSVVGTDALKQLTGELFTTFIDTAETQLKESLINQLLNENSGQNLPNFITNTGVNISVKDIDVFGKLKNNPTSDVGDLLYDNVNNNFDKRAYEAIVNAGTDVTFNNLIINYDNVTDGFKFKTTPASSSKKIGEWLGDFVNDTTIINKKEFLTKVMDTVYGTISSNQEKTKEQIYEELQIRKLIEQLLNDDDSFIIPQSDFDELLRRAQELIDGVLYYDLGCGVIGASLPLSGMTNLISQISGATDAFAVGNFVEGTIQESTVDSEDVVNENKQAIKDGFFQKIIDAISIILIEAITLTPQIRAILAISSSFNNNGIPQISRPLDDIKKFKVFIKCLLQEVKKMINEYIYELIIVFLVASLKPIIKKIIREKINQFIGILKSLIRR